LSKKIHDELANEVHILMTQGAGIDPEYHHCPQSGVILKVLDGV